MKHLPKINLLLIIILFVLVCMTIYKFLQILTFNFKL
jgi:hypothetical protein